MENTWANQSPGNPPVDIFCEKTPNVQKYESNHRPHVKTTTSGSQPKRQNPNSGKEVWPDFGVVNRIRHSRWTKKETQDECGRQSQNRSGTKGSVGKDERQEIISEARQESQTQDECCGKSKDFCCGQETLGKGQGSRQNEAVGRRHVYGTIITQVKLPELQRNKIGRW